ncbi:MAG TPA: phosphoglucosamine mutase [Acidimicrobiales bacterium]|nr:phosphoglucosamine mutase [Acidimicrobiales bacterium]
MPLRFGTDGIRGVANIELTVELSVAVGRAAARHLPGSRFLVGRDTRRSGPMLQAGLSAGLAAEGVTVVDVGVIPTPGLAWLAAELSVPAAMISASHNPFADNGIKLLSAAGMKLPDAIEEAIEGELDALLLASQNRAGVPGPGGPAVGRVEADLEAVRRYEDHLISTLGGRGLEGLRVVLDCANGAASEVAPRVLSRAGAEVMVIEAAPTGVNINAGCGSTSPEKLVAAVLTAGADVGLAFDGDADRVLAVDHAGQVVDGDHLIAMFAIDLAARGELTGHEVVITVMSNLGLRMALAERGIGIVETPVGDRYVSDALESYGLALGGEQSGHIVFRRHATTGDGVLTGLLLLDLMSRRSERLADLAAAAMTRLPQVLESIPVPDPARLGSASGVWEEVGKIEASLAGKGRVLLRPSGTESRVRVMVEAPSESEARAAVDRLTAVVRREIGGSAP